MNLAQRFIFTGSITIFSQPVDIDRSHMTALIPFALPMAPEVAPPCYFRCRPAPRPSSRC
ncbi:hypothetical protein OH687_14930 [Burkholderia anthina]|nr:hypothetical protein OH687_14930 [Burkholderia anthina]